jgi:acetyltransferase-like isoleucine patch superfamily enzyme
MPIIKNFMRFIGMHAPSEKLRMIMYRKAGIKIGKALMFGGHVWIDVMYPYVTIEDDVSLAGFDYILVHSNLPGYKLEGAKPVTIKKGARIGINVTILPGVTIGRSAVIGAGAVVTKDIPDNALAVGVPAKPIRYYEVAK